jgi:dipeptidyl aminopeptidase/acylaminoacyl peptidase
MPMAKIRRLLLLVAGGLLLWQGTRGVRAYGFERQFYRPSTHRVRPPADAAVLGLRDVTFPSHTGVQIRGWYLPSKNGAAIILTHGSNADRAQRLPDARVLGAAGFGVLCFDWPGQGESDGQVTWGPSERSALTGAIDFVAGQPGIDKQHIGAAGFSAGGYFVAQVAATDDRLSAVVLEATPTDLVEQTRAEYAGSGIGARIGALVALRQHVSDPHAMRAVDVVRAIAPRPLLIVGGSEDHTVPPAMVRRLFAAAREPKTLWIVDGATHGEYETKTGGKFGRRLVRLFERTLLSAPATLSE